MRVVLLALLTFLAGCGGCASIPQAGDGAVSLDMGDGTCSGTAVGRYTILTAAHCFGSDTGEMTVDGVLVGYRVAARDGSDHALVYVSAAQKATARVAALPKPGSLVRLLGNPQGLPDLWRRGEFAGVWKVPACPVFKQTPGCEINLFDMNVTEGDSGAGIFDERGRLVAVLSGGLKIPERTGVMWGMVITLPLAFTTEQWALVK
jgi:hypothetical protein